MAIEARRGCGYRKIGGIYLVGKGMAVGCDRLPYETHVCPTCGQGIHASLGFTWVQSTILGSNCLKGENNRSPCHEIGCEVCFPRLLKNDEGESIPAKYGLMWVGEKFYRDPASFTAEAQKLGVSKRVGHIPKGLKVGDFILLGHRKVPFQSPVKAGGGGAMDALENEGQSAMANFKDELKPAIFYGFHVTAMEIIITESQSKDEKFMESVKKRKLTPVVVPDNDKDHVGTVYDKEKEE